jgi:predicted ATPase
MKTRPFLAEVGLKSVESLDWEAFPFNLPAVRSLDSVLFHPSVTFFVGENGSGKSTLLEGIAVANDLVEARSQFIVATHSPILMAYPNACIYECGMDGIRRVEYEQTEHYRVMHDFIANPARMLKILMER